MVRTKYPYKIGYYNQEETHAVELCHENKFSQQEIIDMIAQGIVALKELLIDNKYDYTNTFYNFFIGDGIKNNIIGWLIENKGFEKVVYEQVTTFFGSSDLFANYVNIENVNLCNAIKRLEGLQK